MVRHVILDTDPGIDDAIAIALLLNEPSIQVDLITTVGGNVNLAKTAKNALKLVAFFEKDIPVAAGNRGPLVSEFTDASAVHGQSGMDGYDFPEPDMTKLSKDHAVIALKEQILSNPDKTTLLAVGPLTNIALLFSQYPEVIDKIEELIIMGGAFTRGNKRVMDEFNIGTDPEAAQMVFKSSVKKTMVGLEIGAIATVSMADAEKLASHNETGKMLLGLLKAYRTIERDGEFEMYDPTAVAYLLKPEIFETVDCNVEVELASSLTYGQTVVDLDHKTDRPVNCTVPVNVDRQAFKDWFNQGLSRAK
ncbi:ribonucleoside hydrolase [Aerococcus urinaehominis]|uniref:Ribonucleoside hydrolase n=1 Tax=Aerococcus urinaehominis TaxID=128944 RepID=A0A0X8FKA8_9LACT|nr:nucleoside hydrolase [Aerococcus urinaehominis]AMB98893.1 ribonucleoside hydrolase [Aerococcus urinaehominis]SDM15662.1 non-specific riboncleoside hydrolase [Aerococcus urinaehominis]